MTWPLIERPHVRELIEAGLVRPGRVVMLMGPSGIGKTVLARQVAQARTAAGGSVVGVVGQRELQDAPLAPFAGYLASVSSGEHPGPASARDLIVALSALGPDTLLVVDDAPLLDATSAAVLYQLVRVYGMRALVTVRSGDPFPEGLERLRQEDLVSEVPVDGLDRRELEGLLTGYFGVLPRPDDIGHLERITSGNPLHVRQAVDLAERWGQVRAVPAGVEIDARQIPWSLAESVAARIRSLGVDQRRTLFAASLAGGAPAELIFPAARDLSVLTALEADGFVVLRANGSVRPAHPAYAEAVAAELADSDRDDIVVSIADRLRRTGDPALRFAALRLLAETSADPDPEEHSWGVSRAYTTGEHLLATQLVGGAAHCLTFGAQVDLASALSALGRIDEAESSFRSCEALAESSAERALLLSRWGSHLAYRCFDVSAALSLAERLLPTLVDSDVQLIGPDLRTWRVLAGELDRSGDAGPWVDRQDATAAVAVRGAIASVMLDSMSGQGAEEAARTLLRIERDHGVLDPFAADMVHLQRYFALLSAGEGEAAEQVCLERRPDCTAEAIGMWSLTLGIHWQYGGRLTEARQIAELALAQLSWRDPLGLQGFAQALLALVQVQQGDDVEARRLLDALAEGPRADPKAAMLEAEAMALLRYSEGDRGGAVRGLVEAATTAANAGHGLVAAIGLGLCVRFGEPDAALPLLERILSNVTPGLGLYEALHSTARGLADADPATVLEGADKLARAGMVSVAVDALALAQRRARGAGHGELQRKLERTRQAWAKGSESSALHDAASQDDLSPREWEVVNLVRQRLSSREVGERLGISARTVDNHLANAYRKLGVSSRSQLRDLLAP